MKKNQYDTIHIRMKRFFALIIDWYLTSMIVAIPITFYLRGDNYLTNDMFQLDHYPFYTGLLLGLYGILIGIIYYIIIPNFIWKGQTLGKKICKIQVIKEDGSDVTLSTLILREMIGSTFLEGGIIITATYLRKILPLIGLGYLSTPWSYLAYGLTIISIIYAYFNPLTQSLHDKLAKTIVVNK